MPSSTRSAAAIADVCARLINQESIASIQKRDGFAPATIKRMVAALQKHGLALERPKRFELIPEREELLYGLFRSTNQSNREIARQTGIHLDRVNASRRRFNVTLVQAGDDLPKCGCGKYLHHPRMCRVRLHARLRRDGIASVSTMPEDVQQDIRARLIRGETTRSIGHRVGLAKGLIASVVRTLTSDERECRETAFRTSAGRKRSALIAKKIVRPHATNPGIDPLYAEISTAVPRGIDPALRDDMISQAYLDVLEGRIKRDRLAEGVKKVRGRIFEAFANPWGNVSLDAILGDDRGRAMIERIPAEASAFA